MAKKPRRRAVSMNREVFEDLKRYCKTIDLPMSQFVEDVVREAMKRGHKPKRIFYEPGQRLRHSSRLSGVHIFRDEPRRNGT